MMRSNENLSRFQSPGKMVALWDGLVLALVAFPLLTGGLWFRGNGLFIELSELGIPVIFCAAFGWLLRAKFKIPVEKGYCFTLARLLFSRWMEWLSSRPLLTLWTGAFVNGAIWSLASLRRHWNLESGSYDLGIFTNAIWNLVHQNGYISSIKGGINLFSDHQSPIFWLLAPVFWLIPTPETLLVIQGFGLAAGAVALFFLAKPYFLEGKGRIPGLLAILPLVYWAYLPLRNANAFDFHPEVFMLPVFLWSISEVQRKSFLRRVLGFFLFFLALAAKESAGPVAVGIGLAWILGAAPKSVRGISRGFGVIACLLGAAVFVFDTQWVPGFFGGSYAYQSSYGELGQGLKEILLSPFLKPGIFFPRLATPSALKFYFFTLAPLGFLPIAGFRAFAAVLPGYLMPVLSGAQRVSTQFHYSIEPSIGLFWALILGIQRTRGNKRFSPAKLGLWIIFWALAGFGRSELYRIRSQELTDERAAAKVALSCLSQTAWTAATDSIVPQISTRTWIQRLPDMEGPGRRSVDCVVIDPALGHWPMSDPAIDQLATALPQKGYRAIFACMGLQVFESARAPGTCMRCQPACE